jgi:phosphoglycolate phosphatase
VDIGLNEAYIFDFDGTLVDSEQAIYQCFKTITKKLAPERLKYTNDILIGPPLRDTASKILGKSHQESLDKFEQLFIKLHDEQVIKHTKPYPYADEVLQKLLLNNVSMALATNKRMAPVKKLLKYYGWEKYFKYIECNDSRKNNDKQKMIKKILNSKEFKDSYFVGDTVQDCIAANRNAVKFIRANYGYGNKEDWSFVKVYKNIKSLKELLLKYE